MVTQTARFMRPTWGPPGSCRPHVDPILFPMNLAILLLCCVCCYHYTSDPGAVLARIYYTPASTKRTGITLSVCPSVHLSICPSVDRIVSALYLQKNSSDPFHICTSNQATSKGVSRVMPVSKFKNLKFWRMFLICNFDFVFFWLGIQYDSVVCLIMRRRRVSSEGIVCIICQNPCMVS